MNEDLPGRYKFDQTGIAKEQIQSAAALAIQAGKLPEFLEMLKNAVRLMRTDPHGWGDPEYQSKFVDGVFCHGIIRPVVFRYVIYEQVHGVVLLGVEVFANFD